MPFAKSTSNVIKFYLDSLLRINFVTNSTLHSLSIELIVTEHES